MEYNWFCAGFRLLSGIRLLPFQALARLDAAMPQTPRRPNAAKGIRKSMGNANGSRGCSMATLSR
jgi:hypothetical protein